MLSDEGLRLDVVAHNYFFEIGDRIEFIKEVIQADPDRPPKWKTKQVKSAQLRAELSRTQMAGCESPLANVIHSVIHCARRLCFQAELEGLSFWGRAGD